MELYIFTKDLFFDRRVIQSHEQFKITLSSIIFVSNCS